MEISKAVALKINKICNEKKISVNKLANISCLTQSTVQHLADCRSKNPKLLTIVRICDGLGIKLADFFSDEIFEDIDRQD
jgi:DNA-binding Xre family transcriptional regulator